MAARGRAFELGGAEIVAVHAFAVAVVVFALLLRDAEVFGFFGERFAHFGCGGFFFFLAEFFAVVAGDDDALGAGAAGHHHHGIARHHGGGTFTATCGG